MPLVRKIRCSGKKILFTFPSQLAEAYDITDGEEIEIIPLSKKEFKIRKTKPRQGGSL